MTKVLVTVLLLPVHAGWFITYELFFMILIKTVKSKGAWQLL